MSNATLIKSLEQACSSPEDLKIYLQQKAINHNSYKAYTTINKLEYWISQKAIFLGTGSNWNDKIDRDIFNNKDLEDVNFGMCLSFSTSENVAMWMLYGGMQHQGVMVSYRRSHIKNILSNTKSIELGHWENDNFVTYRVLKENEFKITLSDVLYYGYHEGSGYLYDIKRADEKCKGISKNTIDALTTVKKNIPWCYENECRLIVSISKNYIPASENTVKINIGNVFSELIKENRIYESPNFEGDGKYAKSDLHGTMDWDLCINCKTKCTSVDCKTRNIKQ